MNPRSDKTNLTSKQILDISNDKPEKLFSGDLAIAKNEYYALSRRWHPDHNADNQATAVFQHITELFRITQELIKRGLWRGAGILELQATGSNSALNFTKQIRYFKVIPFELGDMYIGETEVVFAVERQFADLFENARRHISKFNFANEKMRNEIKKYLPENPQYFETNEKLIMVLPKSADIFLLDDLLEYFGGAIDPKHVAWITNRLHNLACYFEYAGIVHHDISPRTFFVSPSMHGGILLGGWWYARCSGEKINALPDRTIKIAPADVIRHKKADGRVDLELVRQTGRELFGNAAGWQIKNNSKIPAAMNRWFNGVTSGSAITDYELWRNVLEMDFGAPRFIKMEIEPDSIYTR